MCILKDSWSRSNIISRSLEKQTYKISMAIIEEHNCNSKNKKINPYKFCSSGMPTSQALISLFAPSFPYILLLVQADLWRIQEGYILCSFSCVTSNPSASFVGEKKRVRTNLQLNWHVVITDYLAWVQYSCDFVSAQVGGGSRNQQQMLV